MIEFRIVSSPDRNQQANYRHEGNEMTFGSDAADMVIDDSAIAAPQFRVFSQGSAFHLENLETSVELRLNGKAIHGPHPLKERDTVSVGHTALNFSVLNLEPLRPPSPYRDPRMNARLQDDSKEKAILDALEFFASEPTKGSHG